MNDDMYESTDSLLLFDSMEETSTVKERGSASEPQHDKPIFFKVTVLLLLIYVAFLETLRYVSTSEDVESQFDQLPYSPANEALKLVNRPAWQDSNNSVFEQPPGPVLDELWEDLLTGQNIRITEEEMEMQNENRTNRVQLADGGYLGLVSVWHDLHCLDIMRRALNMQYYGPRISEEERRAKLFTLEHYDHCIERLRQSVMCHPDLVVYIAEWVGDSHDPAGKVLRSSAQTACVNWDYLDDWARKRALERRAFKLKAGPFENDGNHE